MIRILILDDEAMAVKTLTVMIEKYLDIPHQIIGHTDFNLAFQEVENFKPDVLMLDVMMEPKNGFQFLAELPTRPFSLIFTTSYDNYAIQAIRYSAIDYLLKPIAADELKAALNKVISIKEHSDTLLYQHLIDNLRTQSVSRFTIAIPTLEKTHFVHPDELLRCESDSNYTWFYLVTGEKILASKTLKSYDSVLIEQGFVRTHRSHLVNKKHIKAIGKNDVLILSDGTQLPIARGKKGLLGGRE